MKTKTVKKSRARTRYAVVDGNLRKFKEWSSADSPVAYDAVTGREIKSPREVLMSNGRAQSVMVRYRDTPEEALKAGIEECRKAIKDHMGRIERSTELVLHLESAIHHLRLPPERLLWRTQPKKKCTSKVTGK